MQTTEWEKILENHTPNKGFVYRINQEFSKLSNKGIRSPILVGKWVDAYLRWCIYGKWALENYLALLIVREMQIITELATTTHLLDYLISSPHEMFLKM